MSNNVVWLECPSVLARHVTRLVYHLLWVITLPQRQTEISKIGLAVFAAQLNILYQPLYHAV